MGRKQGRPRTYKLADRRKLATLVKKLGARGARDAAPKPIALSTLLKIAHEFNIELKKGRRPQKAA